jgi:hypothetical protein
MNSIEHIILAGPAGAEQTPVNGLVLTIVWLLAVGLGVYEYGRTKGRIGRALAVTGGGGLLATFIAYPSLLYTTVPDTFKKLIDWAVGLITA